ncbi:peptidase C14 caspase catalytic subunit p20 [Calothrix sp. NIES-4071]|nr:peptidase C14 caspase catalytic subunit p20 [Calothrix sp. NIES-4071]BAZ54434.1 peptidase C14 caspase catalytic subunit p20 [Calothrix sp. NIES-4105]
MANKIYSLLVGINNYASESAGQLYGCIKDVNLIETYLSQKAASNQQWELVQPRKLINEQATRQAIIDGFLQYLCQADSQDVVLFHFSGHGSQEFAPDFWTKDRRFETVVCYDSRVPNGQDLADKELSYLIEQVAKNQPHILIILDCCHSGTATRVPSEVSIREIDSTRKARNLESFICGEKWLRERL